MTVRVVPVMMLGSVVVCEFTRQNHSYHNPIVSTSQSVPMCSTIELVAIRRACVYNSLISCVCVCVSLANTYTHIVSLISHGLFDSVCYIHTYTESL